MLTNFLKAPAVLEILPEQITLTSALKIFSYPRPCEVERLVENILHDLQTSQRYLQISLDPALFTALPPLAAQTEHQLQWKISENLPCPLDNVVYCAEKLDENMYQVSYAQSGFFQNLIRVLENHDCQIDSVSMALQKLQQIQFRKPWFAWQQIKNQSPALHKGLAVLGTLFLILQLSALALNGLETRYWTLRQQQTAQEKLQNSPQKQFTNILQALHNLPAQSRAQHIVFKPDSIRLQGESFRDSAPTLKTWFEQVGAQLVHQESLGSANAQITFTAEINL
jgi:hypothetical protein